MNRVSFLNKHLSWKIVIATLVLYYALFFSAYIIPSPFSKAVIGNIPMNKVLDLQRDGYSTSDAMNFIADLDILGRSEYIRNLLTIDIILPLLSAIAFSLLLYKCITRIHFFHSRFRLLATIPWLTTFLDYTENGTITFAVLNYPAISDTVLRVANVCTISKWYCSSLVLVMSLLLLFMLVLSKVWIKQSQIKVH